MRVGGSVGPKMDKTSRQIDGETSRQIDEEGWPGR